MVFPPLATYIISLHGWQNCLRIFAALHLVCALCSLSYLPVANPKDVVDEQAIIHCNNNTYNARESNNCQVNTNSEEKHLK